MDFSFPKFHHQPGALFDPVLADINWIRRAHALSIPAHEPIAQFRNKKDRPAFSSIIMYAREACPSAYTYPD
jgi:hypothetical protein